MTTGRDDGSDPEHSDVLRAKYRVERDKRVAAQDRRRYVSIEAGSRLDADPFATTVPERAAVAEDLDVVIIGAGISGMCTAVKLLGQGVTSFKIVDKAADFGGTWYWNRYPGLRCDIESYMYLPLLEQTSYMPAERYAEGGEILDYSRKLAAENDLYSRALLQTRVQDVEWDDVDSMWTVATDRGDALRARYVVLSTGGLLHRPKLPSIPGLDTFEGHTFHTSRWDYEYTGGDPAGNLDGLRDKRVAVIGTAATAIQVVPEVAEYAEHLFVVQRTPSIVDERNNRQTDRGWFTEQSAVSGWIEARRESFESNIFGMPNDGDLVRDQWTQIWGLPKFDMPSDGSPPDMGAVKTLMNEYDDHQMDRIRRRIDEVVEDPATAEALKPYYRAHCKRPCFSDLYLPTFNRPNVTLVDTQGRGVDSITAEAIEVGSERYAVDLIIFATGFETAVSPARAGGFDVRGVDGVTLEDRWAEGTRPTHGIYLNGFPNLFIGGGLQNSAVSANATYILESQTEHVAEIIGQLLEEKEERFEISRGAEAAWTEAMKAKSMFDPEEQRGCTPGYYDREGAADDKDRALFADIYGGGPIEYRQILRALRREGRLGELSQAR